jgi:hypothetical protein
VEPKQPLEKVEPKQPLEKVEPKQPLERLSQNNLWKGCAKRFAPLF